jgi:hypothetical protein
MGTEDRAMQQTLGRCPDCGESVTVELREGQLGEILEHGCQARACEYPACSVTALRDEMVQFASGEWFCPGHGLLVATKDLVSLYQAEGEPDWTAISEIIGEMLPDVVAKAEARERRAT